jgi:hypothetical protein
VIIFSFSRFILSIISPSVSSIVGALTRGAKPKEARVMSAVAVPFDGHSGLLFGFLEF